MKYKKKPVVIDAIQWDGSNLDDCIAFLGDNYAGYDAERHMNGKRDIKIRTLDSVAVASINDWLIAGAYGENYPCKPDIFEDTYEPI